MNNEYQFIKWRHSEILYDTFIYIFTLKVYVFYISIASFAWIFTPCSVINNFKLYTATLFILYCIIMPIVCCCVVYFGTGYNMLIWFVYTMQYNVCLTAVQHHLSIDMFVIPINIFQLIIIHISHYFPSKRQTHNRKNLY